MWEVDIKSLLAWFFAGSVVSMVFWFLVGIIQIFKAGSVHRSGEEERADLIEGCAAIYFVCGSILYVGAILALVGLVIK